MPREAATSITLKLCVLLLISFFAAHTARAQDVPYIVVERGAQDPFPVAITSFHAETPQAAQIGREMAGVISANLERSGLFRAIDPRAFLQTPEDLQLQPRFADWKVINAQALVSGMVQIEADGRLRVEFRLWDVFQGRQIAGRKYFTVPQNWRRVAHIISDSIYKRMTGENGYFDTRIVYVAESGPQTRRLKRLAIMDQDGANHRFLTDGSALVLTPRFSPTTQEITYLSYFNDKPRVYLFNIDTGQREILGDFPGMTFAPRFSPDGKRVIMSLADQGNSEVFMMDLRTREIRQLTNHPAIDTSPSMDPESQFIVFNSDRGGSQQLYVMGIDGTDVRRISFGKGRYATPVWSPRGDLIAFTKFTGGKFYIGVMRPDGSGERVLTESFLDEGPTWAPNGRVLMFYRQAPNGPTGQGGSVRLYSVDLTGYNLREIVTPLDASDPAWSPLIP
ncbi:MAG: Tol-Pal system beta propeller repeat protein TolB [Alphaproteobacteria bacterium]|nr:Tol-Pal system beta propeller repeat protein TolB [Alphaproteobacteria bacterium]